MLRNKFITIILLICLIKSATVLYHSSIVSQQADRIAHYLFPLGFPDSTVQEEIVPTKPPTIEEKVEGCMRKAHLNSEPLLTQAKQNARYFLEEYRKAIPEKSLSRYRSHCWNSTYSATWNRATRYLTGSVGNVTFRYDGTALFFYPYAPIFSYISKHYHQRFQSSIICLPNVFVIGYEKCGTTFIFSFIDDLISMSTGVWKQRQIAKEPQFWARFEAYEDAKKQVPKAEDLGRYFINYIPGIDAISKLNKTDLLLVDGTPNYVTEWPVFMETENNMSNYCLLPAALPTLFPNSKYIAIMRNPIDMVYSNFWWSCVKNLIKIPVAVRGPDIFHDRIVSKIHTFNNCMRNKSMPSISSPCGLVSKQNYSACIKQRLHLLDKCSADILASEYSPELPHCGDSSLSLGLFYVHTRKWLGLVGRDNLLLLTLEELNQHPSDVAIDILQFLDLNITIATSEENIKKAMQTGDMNSQNTYDYKKTASLHIRNDTRTALEIFYHPFNELLAELLMDNKYVWF